MTEDAGIAAKAPLPKAVADDDDRLDAAHRIRGLEKTAERGSASGAENRPRNEATVGDQKQDRGSSDPAPGEVREARHEGEQCQPR